MYDVELMGEKVRMLCARITEETKRRFKARVAELGLDNQTVIGELIERWLSETEAQQPPSEDRPRRRKRGS
jgi:hypothetical protein